MTAPIEWILVPKNPTKEMIKAGESWSGLPSATWTDMLDAAPMRDEAGENISAMAILIKRSIAFADWAAGEGISPSLTGEGATEDLDPENFLYAYSQATGDEDWLSLASRISKAFEDLKAENAELREQLFRTAEKLTMEGVEELRSEFEYQRGAEEEFRSHSNQLKRERDWS